MKTTIPRLALCLFVCSIADAATASAQQRGGGGGGAQGTAVQRPPAPPPVVHRGEVFIGGYFYDPIWGPYPWWPRPIYPHRYFPIYDARAAVRVDVTPRDAAVYVDGFYAGVVDEFDGAFQRLYLTPGGHELVLYLRTYRTERHHIYLGPGTTVRLRATLERLPPGEISERPWTAPPVPPPPRGSFREPRRPARLPEPAIVTARPVDALGTLDLRVQPLGARVTIDDEAWVSSDPKRFVIDLAAGTHRLKISLDGYQTYSADIVIRDDEVTALNVSLSKSAPR